MSPDTPTPTLADRLKAEAHRLGFDRVGIAPAVAPPGYESFRRWLDEGHQAGMAYLEKRFEARSTLDSVLPGVRSIVVVSLVYGEKLPPPDDPRRGRVARYARGADYHDLFWRRLEALLAWLQAESPGIQGRAACDTAPVLERDYARLAGLGWVGKNTMLIDRKLGSFTLLGALLIDVELDYDPPSTVNHCGTCTRCLDACPTDAFAAPYVLDSRRCISYWTIEHRGPIPDEAADNLHGWAFGCDICQDVCPWNRKAPPGRIPELGTPPGWSDPDLIEWLGLDPTEFSRRVKGTALSRAKRSGLLRNAALLLGSRGVSEAITALSERLRTDSDPLVRASAAWALGRIGGSEADRSLAVGEGDEEATVREAVARARMRIASKAIVSSGPPEDQSPSQPLPRK